MNGAPSSNPDVKGVSESATVISADTEREQEFTSEQGQDTRHFCTRVTAAISGVDSPVDIEGGPCVSKKDAEREAARRALECLEEEDIPVPAPVAACEGGEGNGDALAAKQNWKGALLEWLRQHFKAAAPEPQFTTERDPLTLQFCTRVTVAIPGVDSPVDVVGGPCVSKKDAEREAARQALERLKEEDIPVPAPVAACEGGEGEDLCGGHYLTQTDAEGRAHRNALEGGIAVMDDVVRCTTTHGDVVEGELSADVEKLSLLENESDRTEHCEKGEELVQHNVKSSAPGPPEFSTNKPPASGHLRTCTSAGIPGVEDALSVGGEPCRSTQKDAEQVGVADAKVTEGGGVSVPAADGRGFASAALSGVTSH